MKLAELKDGEVVKEVGNPSHKEGEKKPFKKDWYRFEFALFINDFLICKRGFPINGYIDGSMQTLEFKNEVDSIVELIDEDLKSKSRVYVWHHFYPEHPEWDPEVMTDPLVEEGQFVFKFVVYDGGKEVIARSWDGRYYPSYVRKNVDLTNRQVKIIKDDHTNIYDKEAFFNGHESQVSGDLYVLKSMISDKENLIPMIQKSICEVCSVYGGKNESLSDFDVTVDYNNRGLKLDKDGNPVYIDKQAKDKKGKLVTLQDAFGNPWKMQVLEDGSTRGKCYNFNIEEENKKLYRIWGSLVANKTRKHISDLYVNPKEKYFKKKEDAD